MLIPDGLTYPSFFFIASLICIILFWVFFLKKGEKNFQNMQLLREIYGKNSYFSFLFIFFALAITLIYITIFSQPYISQSIEKQVKNGIDISIIIDLSYSMNAGDISPSRIESAKTSIKEFIRQLESDRVWVILFAGKPFQSVPLSFDYDFVQDFISEISVETINQSNPNLVWSAIGDALVLWTDTLEKEQEREKIIILITDWSANTGIDPLIAAKYAADNNIKIYTLWVWKDENTFVEIVSPLWFVQRTPVWPVDEEMLEKISTTTNWKYYRADNTTSFKKILGEIAELEKSEIEYESISFHEKVYGLFLGVLCILYSLLCFIIFMKKIRF